MSGKLIKQKGFTIIEVMFFVLVGAIIVGGAYYVGSQKDNNNSQSQNSSQIEKESISNDGNYENTEYGFKFSYPKEWGTVKTDSYDGEKGKTYVLTFTDNEAYYGVFATKDYYQPPPEGRGGGCSGGTEIFPDGKLDKEYQGELDFYEIKTNEPDLKVVFMASAYIAPETGCPLMVGGLKLFSNQAKIDSLSFYYNRDDQFKNEKDIADYYNNPVDFYSETEQNIFTKLMRSIKEI